ncbi:hypothetical protein SGRA_3995 [Saprospira grandis str. Lewin]|uniref:Secreted protein n=1 Tax=Saprospira grandis (strain Lewin) TaxID=984262 RepID=H6L8I5_SAPGL|nr:hypothetical protein SGRA_3995 [Saprospira grandis str. Lewin]
MGLPTRFARVGLCRSSQVCSALRKKALCAFLLALALRATAIHPSAEGGRPAFGLFAPTKFLFRSVNSSPTWHYPKT